MILTEGGYYGTTCFLAQQIVEKYLKGFLVLHGKKFTKIHDLVKLLNDCAEYDQNFLQFLDDCILLNEYYIESRYPLDAPIDYSRKEARQALSIAEKIMNYIASKVKESRV